MDLFDDMRLFIAVAQTKSFSAASKATGTPLSSISRRVTGLETRLGVPLLHRTSRNVALTELGRTYLERARAIVDATRAAEEELRSTVAASKWRPLIPVHAVTPTMNPPKKIRLLLDCLRDHIVKVRARVARIDPGSR